MAPSAEQFGTQTSPFSPPANVLHAAPPIVQTTLLIEHLPVVAPPEPPAPEQRTLKSTHGGVEHTPRFNAFGIAVVNPHITRVQSAALSAGTVAVPRLPAAPFKTDLPALQVFASMSIARSQLAGGVSGFVGICET